MLSNKFVIRFLDVVNTSHDYELFNYYLVDGFVVVSSSRNSLLLLYCFLEFFMPIENFILEYDLSGFLTLKISVYAE